MNANELKKVIDTAAAGREEGYRKLFSEFGGIVFSLISRMVGDTADAEELTQDVFLKLFGTLQHYQQQGVGFAAWIRRIAYNKAIDHLRRTRPNTISIDDVPGFQLSVEHEENVNVSELKIEQLMQAIANLPEKDRTLLHLFYIDDLPLKEIAFITSTDSTTLAMRLSRIRQRLKKQLASTL